MERKKMDKQKILFLVLSFLVAVTLWIFVDVTGGELVEIEIKDIPIEYLSTDTVLAQRGLMLLEEGTTQTVDVKLVATRWNSTSLDRSAVRASADLIDVTETGTQRVTISIFYNNEAEGITKKSTSPSMATVNIGELYHKEVEVRCERVGGVPGGPAAAPALQRRSTHKRRPLARAPGWVFGLSSGSVAYSSVFHRPWRLQ